MSTLNLDATQHQWVELLERFMFSIEYQKGQENVAADALSWVTSKLDAETMKSILDGVTVGMTERADIQDLVVAKADEEIHKEVQKTAILAQATCVNLHVTDWVTAQQEDPILKTVIEWISGWKVWYLTPAGRWCKYWRGKNYSPRPEEANALPRSPLPLPHPHWQIGQCFVIHSLQGSLSSCHEWMSPKCWTPGSANTVLAAWPVLVARNGHSDAEGN